MDGQGITPEQLDAVLWEEYQSLKQRICDAVNTAKCGRIIDETQKKQCNDLCVNFGVVASRSEWIPAKDLEPEANASDWAIG